MDATSTSMEERLALDPVEGEQPAFESRHPTDEGHVFGGLLLGQALRAGSLADAAGRPARSLHATFVLAGSPGERVRYEVERVRDGRSFATLRVTALQGRGVVLVATVDLHAPEPGDEYDAPAPVGVPGPGACPVGRYDNPHTRCRDVPVGAGDGAEHVRRAWFSPTAPLPDDPALHQQVLAYTSDFGATRAAREPHAHLADDAARMSVSLDHSVWFHRPIDAGGWTMVEWAPAATGAGRGLVVGSIRSEAGELAATIAQAVLLRRR